MLLAAAGLLIPLAIHLWNKRPPKLLATGSIRWFRGSTSQSARNLQLKELPLLLLRCLLLLIFCFLMAGLYWRGAPAEKENKRGLYLVEAGIAAGKPRSWVDSLLAQGKKARLLAPGLPPLADSLRWKEERIDIWGIMKEADAQQDFTGTVWVNSVLLQGYFSGERPWVHKHFVFIEPDYPQQARSFPAQLIKEGDALLGTKISYAPDRIAFQTRELTGSGAEENNWLSNQAMPSFFKGGKAVATLPDTFHIEAVVSKTYEQDAEIIRKAFQVLDEQLPAHYILFQEEGEIGNVDLALWFSNDSLPAELREAGVPVLGISRTRQAGLDWIIKSEEGPSITYLRERPLPALVESEELATLPLALLELLPEGIESRYKKYLHMPSYEAQPYQLAEEGIKSTTEKKSLHEWLWVLLFVLFGAERLWVNLK